MTDLIIFTDANGRKKTASSIRIVKHNIRDAINNTVFDEPWVEIHVVGKTRVWTEYMSFNEFSRLNPSIARKLWSDFISTQ
jgi:hypothetical protein